MNELPIEQKIRDMMIYAYVALRQFPKHERHVLAAEIRASMLQLLRLTITAAKRYHKKTTLQDLDVELAALKAQVRLAHRLLRKGSVKRIKYKLRKLAADCAAGRIGIAAAYRPIASWLGHASHANARRLTEKLLSTTLIGSTK